MPQGVWEPCLVVPGLTSFSVGFFVSMELHMISIHTR